ncbi:hypothetical protein QC764_0068280 [Podospora pseudoanserina]|uniref:Uncharacterized protein n=1 Tax=Podospora pseudoanserina TaxID=2609844 RepID=A0ABR0IBH0_9PEZI|nr:hypothetical protein QC764_0068280 [Podospora pseudoanserina]
MKTHHISLFPLQTTIPFVYPGLSLSGNSLVPNSGPHCPTIFSTAMPTPRLVSLPWLFNVHGRTLAILGKTPPAAKKTEKYRTETRCSGRVASSTYPAPPTRERQMIVRPRCWVLSAR